MFTVRSVLPLLGGLLVLALALPAQAQTLKPSRQAAGLGQAASSEVINGVTYYYDANGNPLYYDDPVHYSPPKRFYWRNGGWVMASSGRGGVRSGGAIRSRGIRRQSMPTDAAGHPKSTPPHTDAPAATPAKPQSVPPATTARRPEKSGVPTPAQRRAPSAAKPGSPFLVKPGAPALVKPVAPAIVKPAAPSRVQPAPSGGGASKARPAAAPAPAKRSPRGK